MAGLKIESVGITPQPVETGHLYKISVGVNSGDHFAFVGDFVGAFVNTAKLVHLPIAHVGDYTKKQE